MTNISDAQRRLADLIRSRISVRQVYTPAHGSSARALGEKMLNNFANEIQLGTLALSQNERTDENLLEDLINTLALAALLDIDLESKLNEILTIMDNVSAEAS